MFDNKRVAYFISLLLILSVCTYGQGNIFKKIRYQGGTVASTVKPKDWNNILIVTNEEITLKLRDGNVAKIESKDVTGLSYGQEAHRRVGTMIALAVFLTPLALFGLFHKKRDHFIGIEWADKEGKLGGVLLQADKSNYRAVLMALRGATGAAVSVADVDRKYVPIGIKTVVVKESDSDKKEDDAKKPDTDKDSESNR